MSTTTDKANAGVPSTNTIEISRIEHRRSAEIHGNLSYKFLTRMCENEWLDPQKERPVMEAYINHENTYFSTIYIFNGKGEIISLFVHIDTKATKEEVDQFLEIIFRPIIINKHAITYIIALNFQEAFWETLLRGFKTATEGSYDGFEVLDFWLPPADIQGTDKSLPAGYKCRTLEVKHAELIAHHWSKEIGDDYSNFDVVEFVSGNIYNRPSVGVFYQEEEMPVAWMLTYYDAECGMLHVSDGHTRKGLGGFLIKVMFDKLKECFGFGFPVSINKKNALSAGMFSKRGWVKQNFPCQMFVYKIKKE